MKSLYFNIYSTENYIKTVTHKKVLNNCDKKNKNFLLLTKNSVNKALARATTRIIRAGWKTLLCKFSGRVEF